MIPAADHIEAPTEEPVDDGRADPATAAGEATRRSGRLGRLLVGCLAAEAAVVVVVAAALSIRVGGAVDEPPIDEGGERVAAMTAAPDDSQTFVRAWEQAIASDPDGGGDFETTGTLTRVILDEGALYSSAWPDPDTTPGDRPASAWPYRQLRSAGRLFTQIGNVATIIDRAGGHETCIQRTRGIVCSPAGNTDGNGITDGHVAISVAGVEKMVRGDTATHRVTAIDSADVLVSFPRLPPEITCWEARSRTGGVGLRWGRRAQFCFHVPTGAGVFRRILGTTRLEVLVVDSVTEDTNLGP